MNGFKRLLVVEGFYMRVTVRKDGKTTNSEETRFLPPEA